MDKKLHETTNSCVEIMDSKRRETWLRGTNSLLPFDVNVMLNLSRSVFISASILKHAQRWRRPITKAKQRNFKAKIATISVVSVRYYKYAVDLQKVY